MSHANPLQLDLTALEDGQHHLQVVASPQEAGLDPALFGPVQVAVQLDLVKDRVFVLLETETEATLECDRTLQPFTQDVEGSYQVLFAPPDVAERHAEDETDAYEEVRVLDPAARRLDLSDLVRDTVLLSLPARRIAPGAEALDLQTTYGEPADGDAIDPRWEALRGLTERDEE